MSPEPAHKIPTNIIADNIKRLLKEGNILEAIHKDALESMTEKEWQSALAIVSPDILPQIPQKKSKKWLIILGCCLITILILAGGWTFFTSNKEKSPELPKEIEVVKDSVTPSPKPLKESPPKLDNKESKKELEKVNKDQNAKEEEEEEEVITKIPAPVCSTEIVKSLESKIPLIPKIFAKQNIIIADNRIKIANCETSDFEISGVIFNDDYILDFNYLKSKNEIYSIFITRGMKRHDFPGVSFPKKEMIPSLSKLLKEAFPDDHDEDEEDLDDEKSDKKTFPTKKITIK